LAARPELTAVDLRGALADALSADAMMPPPSETLKAEYLCSRNMIGDVVGAFGELSTRPLWKFLTPGLTLVGYQERIQRSLKLVFANLLTQIDRPRFKRTARRRGTIAMFELDPASEANPKVYSPEKIERWAISGPGPDAEMLGYLSPKVEVLDFFDYERVGRVALVVGLALQLHYREHGQFPAALEELVANRYLKEIPADPFGKGEPIHYRREPDARQGAVLWSVWTDGIDQDGRVDVTDQKAGNACDRVFRIAAPAR
jgi:hypothetical protein